MAVTGPRGWPGSGDDSGRPTDRDGDANEGPNGGVDGGPTRPRRARRDRGSPRADRSTDASAAGDPASGDPTPAGPPPGVKTIRIGLWGATSSGKSTLIGVLPWAAARVARGGTRGSQQPSWTVTGGNPSSRLALDALTEDVIVRRKFPASTQANRHLNLLVRGDNGQPPPRRAVTTFAVDVLDVPGRLFGSGQMAGLPPTPDPEQEVVFDADSRSFRAGGRDPASENRAELTQHIADCDGIVLLIDPARELDGKGQASLSYFHGMMHEVYELAHRNGRADGNRLLHQLSVCLTKFDHPQVLESALTRPELEEMAGHARPRIRPDVAHRYFEYLCARPDSTMRFIQDSINGRFFARHVRYFATSSVGFFVPENGRFDPRDPGNVDELDGAEPRIRGPIAPMNALEPILSLATRIKYSDETR